MHLTYQPAIPLVFLSIVHRILSLILILCIAGGYEITMALISTFCGDLDLLVIFA